MGSPPESVGAPAGPVVPVVAGYRVEALLGEGGMGQVWRATRESDGREVAIKLVRAALLGNPTSRAYVRFLRETNVCKTFGHPNLVKILDGGTTGHRSPFLVMEFVHGATLADLLGEGLLTEARCTDVARQVAEAFLCFHPRGLVHRDVKPANIIIERDTGRVVLLDFGLARVAEATAITGTSELLGTPSFMPPEQYYGAVVDARTDIFALGATLYLCATGDLPYRFEDLVVDGRPGSGRVAPAPRPPSELVPALSAGFSSVLLRCLSFDPARRYQDAAALAADLAALAEGKVAPDVTLRAPALSSPGAARGVVRAWRFLALGLAAGALLAAALLVGRGPPAPSSAVPSAELDRLRDRLVAAPGEPLAADCAALGAAAARQQIIGRLGVVGTPEPAAAGLYYLARWSRRANQPAAGASLRWYELLLERHGPRAIDAAAGTAVEEYVAAAVAAGAPDRCADALGRLGAAAGPPEVRHYYAFWRASALAALAAPQAAGRALEALEPVLRRVDAGDASPVFGLVPLARLLFLEGQLQERLSLPALRDAWAARLRRLAAEPGQLPDADRGPLLLRAAAGLATDLRSSTVYRPGDLAASTDFAREALRLGRTAQDRALARLLLGEALAKAGQNDAAVTELEQVAADDLPRDRRYALHWTLGCAHDLLFRPADAGRSFARARAAAATPGQAAAAEERLALSRAATAVQGR